MANNWNRLLKFRLISLALENCEGQSSSVLDTMPLHSFAIFSSCSKKVKRNDLDVKWTLSRCSARANLTGFFHRKTIELSLSRVGMTRQSDSGALFISHSPLAFISQLQEERWTRSTSQGKRLVLICHVKTENRTVTLSRHADATKWQLSAIYIPFAARVHLSVTGRKVNSLN